MTKLLNLTSILCSSSRGKESRFHSWNVGTVTAQKCVSILPPPHPPTTRPHSHSFSRQFLRQLAVVVPAKFLRA